MLKKLAALLMLLILPFSIYACTPEDKTPEVESWKFYVILTDKFNNEFVFGHCPDGVYRSPYLTVTYTQAQFEEPLKYTLSAYSTKTNELLITTNAIYTTYNSKEKTERGYIVHYEYFVNRYNYDTETMEYGHYYYFQIDATIVE